MESSLTYDQGNLQVIGGNGQITPELAKLIQDQTGVVVPVGRKSRRSVKAFKA